MHDVLPTCAAEPSPAHTSPSAVSGGHSTAVRNPYQLPLQHSAPLLVPSFIMPYPTQQAHIQAGGLGRPDPRHDPGVGSYCVTCTDHSFRAMGPASTKSGHANDSRLLEQGAGQEYVLESGDMDGATEDLGDITPEGTAGGAIQRRIRSCIQIQSVRIHRKRSCTLVTGFIRSHASVQRRFHGIDCPLRCNCSVRSAVARHAGVPSWRIDGCFWSIAIVCRRRTLPGMHFSSTSTWRTGQL